MRVYSVARPIYALQWSDRRQYPESNIDSDSNTISALGQTVRTPAAAFPPAFSHLVIASLTFPATSSAVVFLPNASTNWPRGSIR